MTLNGCNSKDYTSIRGWLRDVFFLDFYLDKDITFRFKLAEFVFGGEELHMEIAFINNWAKKCKHYAQLYAGDEEAGTLVDVYADKIIRSTNEIRFGRDYNVNKFKF